MTFGDMEWEARQLHKRWFRRRPPIQRDCVTSFQDCLCWQDLARLARWRYLLAMGYQEGEWYRWTQLCVWAWDKKSWWPKWPEDK